MAAMSTGQHDVLRVSTPDNIAIAYDLAGLGSRIIAQLLDSLIVAVVAIVVAVGVVAVLNPSSQQQPLAGLAASGVTLVVYVGYFTMCEVSSGGGTPGKSALQLRVLDVGGSAPTAGQLLLRNVARIIDVLLGLGIVVMFPEPAVAAHRRPPRRHGGGARSSGCVVRRGREPAPSPPAHS